MIYVIQTGNYRWVKIGYTASSAERRVAELQTGNPEPLQLVKAVDGTIQDEQRLHAAIRGALMRLRLPPPINEWYPGRHPLLRAVVQDLSLGVSVVVGFADDYASNKSGLQAGDEFKPLSMRKPRDRQNTGSPRAQRGNSSIYAQKRPPNKPENA